MTHNFRAGIFAHQGFGDWQKNILLDKIVQKAMQMLHFYKWVRFSNVLFSNCPKNTIELFGSWLPPFEVNLDVSNKWIVFLQIDNWTESKWLFKILNLTERIQTKNREFVITSEMNPEEEVFRTVFKIEK